MPVSVSIASRGRRTSTHSDEAERSLVLLFWLSQFASAAALAPSPKPELVGYSTGEAALESPLVRSAVGTASISVRPALAMVGSVPTGYWAVSVASSAGCPGS